MTSLVLEKNIGERDKSSRKDAKVLALPDFVLGDRIKNT